MAALLRQYHPDWTAGQVRDSLKKSGSLASTPDTLRGWGVPDLRRFLGVRGAGNISSHPVLPSVWRPSRGALQFRAGTPSERFEFVFRSLGGRVLHRSSVSPGQSVWAGSPPPGTYVASWSVPGGGGSSIVIVTDR